jgi:citrate lyase subunit beta/citryl-CoA lyase
MRLRSLLFVPGDRPERFEKAAGSGADAIILDLEDSVSADRKSYARTAVAEYLAGPRPTPALVRINPLTSKHVAPDIAAILRTPPNGLVLPKAEGAACVARLSQLLGGQRLPILPIATETPAAVFELGSYRQVRVELMGLTWGAEDLSAAVGSSSVREAGGDLTAPYQTVRSLALFAAHAACVPAVETVFPDIDDLEGLQAHAHRARRDGFSGMLAIHPAQIPAIHAAFRRTDEQLREARAIVAAFAGNPEAGTLRLNGRMIDRPHLLHAQRILEQPDD